MLYTYERLTDPEVTTPYSSNYSLVKNVTAPDPHTVRVAYREPFVPALESWGMGIVPRHVFGGARGKGFNSHPANRSPIGTGPYRFIRWDPDEKIILEANPGYFRGRPKIPKYVFRIIPDQSVEFLELRNKSIDILLLTPDQYHAYPEFFEGYKKYRLPRAVYTYLGFNLDQPLFRDKKVRTALAMAIDKEDLVRGVLMGLGRAATGPYLPLSWAFDPGVKDFDHDPKRAAEILGEAGWTDSDGDGVLDRGGRPFEFTIITNQGNKMRSLSAEIIQEQLARIGVKVQIRVLEWSTFLKDFIDKHKFDACILGWSLSPDPDQHGIWHSSQRGEGRYNFVSYSNPEVDRLLEAGRREFDPEKRKRLYRRTHRLIHDDIPYVFLYYPDQLPVVSDRVEGVKLAPLSSFGFGWNFEEWRTAGAPARTP